MRNTCICIPVVNDSHCVEKLILECLDRNPGALIVIDDGMAMPVEECLFSHQVQRSIQGGQLKIIRHSQNLGRNSAILTGHQMARDMGFQQIITVDETTN